ncbi:carbohydrate ABC transporter permease [Mahella australiensis]|uniref:Carbohydrate ABC transporter membrane protein 2, CUT1 family n=1 Tax=Mahella australiensis (strain DSM 15567 / CIP 107919 / 50-1 BON) TaxID=697281 RepID=F4A0T0_MAHA5|nr:carbohydrate ABC transporter permease [Mahella australiensis]AEE96976.1 carbohydrate ABC transporter membrane protein 2, CUT1 family [Mahella australiensis 50-1 BON]
MDNEVHVQKLKESQVISAWSKPGSLLTTSRVQGIAISAFRFILFAALIYILLYPLLWAFSNSLKFYEDMVDPTTIWIPKHPTLSRYLEAWNAIQYVPAFINSLNISLSTAVLQVITCSFIGYGFARFNFKEKNLIFALVMLTLIIPPQTTIISQYVHYSNFDVLGIISLLNGGKGLNLLDTYAPFILPTFFGLGLKSGLFIYIFRQFFRGMPQELEDAAYIDGCGPLQTYIRIMLPNTIPAIVTVFLFSFVWHWNDVFEPTMYIQSFSKYPLSLKLISIDALIGGYEGTKDVLIALPAKDAGVILIMLPMLILYIIGQRYFVESVERTGIVG